MTHEEFDEVLQEVRRQLQRSGVGEVAFDDYYLDESDRRVADPRGLAVAMLRAFDLHLSLLDNATYRKSLSRIRQAVDRQRLPARAIIEMSVQDQIRADMRENVDLSKLPKVLQIRNTLSRLIAELAETPYDEVSPPPRITR